MPSPAVPALLERTTFFVKEHVSLLKLTDTYDILDPETSERVGLARETPPAWAKWLRLLVNKKILPTAVTVTRGGETDPPLFRIVKPFSLLRPKVRVEDASGAMVGYFKAKIFSLGGGFWVYDTQDRLVAEVKGDWKGWNFRFIDGAGKEIGQVTKKWAGIGKELLTSADNYVVSLTPGGGDAAPNGSMVLLAAALSIDIIFKENAN